MKKNTGEPTAANTFTSPNLSLPPFFIFSLRTFFSFLFFPHFQKCKRCISEAWLFWPPSLASEGSDRTQDSPHLCSPLSHRGRFKQTSKQTKKTNKQQQQQQQQHVCNLQLAAKPQGGRRGRATWHQVWSIFFALYVICASVSSFTEHLRIARTEPVPLISSVKFEWKFWRMWNKTLDVDSPRMSPRPVDVSLPRDLIWTPWSVSRTYRGNHSRTTVEGISGFPANWPSCDYSWRSAGDVHAEPLLAWASLRSFQG